MKLLLQHAFFFIIFYQSLALKNHDHVILQGTRCISRCLQNFVNNYNIGTNKKYKTGSRLLTTENSFDSCLSRRSCSECIQPCGERFTSLERCLALCKGNLQCMYSCAFISDINGKKMGYCSAPTVAQDEPGSSLVIHLPSSSNQSTCSEECQTDFGCSTNNKCCRFGCSSLCRPALTQKSWMPSLINNETLTLTEREDGKSVVLSWEPVSSASNNWVMYVIQERHHLSRGIPQKFKSAWKIITETSDSKVVFFHLQRGYWYQFRIAVVNKNGTKGFTVLRQPFRLTAGPRRPPTPTDFKQVALRITRGARYNIQVKWKLPKDQSSDLPVKGFHVTWVKVSQSGYRVRHTPNRRYVKASTSILLEGYTYWITWVYKLHFGDVYNVSVAASSGWKEHSLFSAEAHLQLRYPLETPTQELKNLKIDLPFFLQNDSAAVNISWAFEFTEAPEKLVKFFMEWEVRKCLHKLATPITNQELSNTLSFRLTNLLLGCEYNLTVQAMYGSFRHQWSRVKQLTFHTPPCGLIEPKITTELDNSCPKDFLQSSAPLKLKTTGVVSTPAGIMAQLHWKPPVIADMTTGQSPDIVGYFLYLSNDVTRNKNIRWTVIKAKKNPSWTFDNLLPRTTYSCHVVAIFSNRMAGDHAITNVITRDPLPGEQISVRNSQNVFYYG